MFSNSFNIKDISNYAHEFVSDGRQDSIIVSNNKTWCTFSYKAGTKNEKVFTAGQLAFLSTPNESIPRDVLMSLLMNNCQAKPLDAYFIASSGALNLISFEGIAEVEKRKLLLGFEAKLKKSSMYFSDEEFYELAQTALAIRNDGQIVRALQSCAFEYLKHRRFTPSSAASKFMIDTYFSELGEVKDPTEKHIIDILTANPETTLTETFLQKMAHTLAYSILTSNSKALNNIRQLSAGCKPYKMCHNIDFNSLMDLLKTKLRLKNPKIRSKNIQIFRDHLKSYSVTNGEFLTTVSTVLEIKNIFNKDECYAAFCLTGDSHLKGTYPNNFLNIMRRIWYMFFTLDVKLSGRSIKTATREALENVEIKSYWERRKGKPVCNYDTLKANAPSLKIDINVIRNMDTIPIMNFLKKYYS